MTHFHVGQKVIYLGAKLDMDDWLFEVAHPFERPVIDGVYTVTNVYRAENGELHLEIAEIPAPLDEHYYAGFYADNFRPVTSIAVFERMLIPARKTEPVA
jgi:hypothetical protein